MSNKIVPYKVEISFIYGKGFSVTVSQPGETRICPDNFLSLESAARFAEKILAKAGFTTAEKQG